MNEGATMNHDQIVEFLVPVITTKVPSLAGSYAAPRELASAIVAELRRKGLIEADGEGT